MLLVSAPPAVTGTGAVVGAAPEPLIWSVCPERPTLDCAELTVPLDRSDPESPSVELAVRRLPAAEPSQRVGTLVTIAGGPGQRGIDLVSAALHAPGIAARFDIVSFDPRGTSGETAITCIPRWDPYRDLDRTPDDPAERQSLDARTRELAADCRAAHGPILPFIGTADAVLDLEALRVALGEEHIALLGSSYGSTVATRYADAFPQRVRAVVLDGYRDPNATPPERELEQAAAFERELDELLVECALREDCALGGPDPAASLDELLESLDRTPLPAGEGRLSQGDVYEALTGALVRGPSARLRLLDALGAAVDGNGAPALELADQYRDTFEATGLDLGTFSAISCADDAATWARLPDEAVATLSERIGEVAPRLGPWLWSPPAAEDLPPVGLCAMMPPEGETTGPQDEPAGLRVDAAGAGPILVLAASGDPATPIAAARRAMDDLEEAALLTVRADQHLVYPFAVAAPDSPTGRCVIEAVESYLVELELPATGRCP